MFKARCLMIAVAALCAVALAPAQFDGPAPLSWRWAASTRVSPVGSPIVDGNTVYVAVGQRIYALDKETGNKKWQFPVSEPINGYFTSGLLMAEGVIVAAADNKNIYAVDANGEAKWQHSALVNIIGRPVIAGKFLVYAMNDNSLMALDIATGEPVWNAAYKVFDGMTGRLGAYGSNVIFFTNTFEMRSVNVNTQKTDWRQKLSVVAADAEPVVFGDTIYLNTGQYIASMNASTGRTGRQTPIGEELAFSPAASAEGVIVTTREGKVIMLDTGLRLNKKTVDLGSMPIVRPTAVGKMFVIPTANGALNLVDPATGAIVWSYIIRPMTTSAAPQTGGGEGNVGRGNFGAPPSGSQANAKVVSVPASGPAVLAGKTLLVLARDGSLLAFDRDTGVDLTPPTVKMTWPNAGDHVNGQNLEIIFKIEDEASGINNSTLKITINGKDAVFDFGRDGYAVIRISQLAKNRPLPNGRAAIVVTVSDWMGNTVTANFALLIDNLLRPVARPTGTEGPQREARADGEAAAAVERAAANIVP